MAGRVSDRIFDLIDAGKLGQAEGLLEDALSKFPNDHAVLAAEALLLLRKKVIDKARSKAEALSLQNVTDGSAVNALVHVLQQCCSWEALVRTYERLKGIQDEKVVLENLFQTYVRMGAYNMAQKTALQLNSGWPNPRYHVWVVQSMLAQVPRDSVDHALLKVSANLLEAAVLTEKGTMTTSTSRTYVQVLQQQKLYADAVKFLCSTRGASVGLPPARLEMLAKVLQLNGELAKANAVAKQLWTHQPENWTFVELYLNSLSESNATEGVLELDGPEESKCVSINLSNSDRTLEDALRFARSLSAESLKGSSGGRLGRGPSMAVLEILSRLGDDVQLRNETVAYAKRFYKASCCFLDISTYVDATAASAIYAWSQEDGGPEGKEPLHYHMRRILGLRCHVALWGITAETQPSHAEVEELLQACIRSYEEARPLSENLSWSEEGLCDGYITVALNISLHVYEATKNVEWVQKGLALLDSVDRRENNPTWLTFSVCFARILGLADVAACCQLDFKSIQRDTMSHVGYWPLVAGGALDGVCEWNTAAWEHYGMLQRDCSLLRIKVFTYMSWPAMKDIQEYERRQTNSLARVIYSLSRIAGELRQCQTQRNVFDLMQAEERVLSQVFEALQDPQAKDLVDNTDWVVVRSMVLGNIHSQKVEALANTLVGMPTVNERVEHARQLVGSLMLLHDVSMLEAHRVQVSNLPKRRKGKGGKSDAAPQDVPLPMLLCQQHTETLQTLPVMSSIAPLTLEFVKTYGNGARIAHTDSFAHALRAVLEVENIKSFLFPEASILTALLQVAPTSTLPVAAWAKDLQAATESARDRLRQSPPMKALGKREQKIREASLSRINSALTDILREAAAASRRR
ncbi:hypothetical protein, conserved [Trypanosoma brucei gambiense DAL972]|uniref:N-acetyltransferase B complex (NatB) non catalytic subunit n=1 Tax=Trypanosoma brucei gambiense (strain MHOM/CI/86/DAL972) TaxID=679716 RepID=C9ZQK9_TRYB9|nr:hypothetical protein, conserved [Trypanosoma brucei gambiense DAL972]CBH11689.1 hypothetical protein, conserved [Trypanosoma brucei gambiense DAL972]|eukprot:XP_011773974.1 hypothetical protein, conserved [Trypanosoma brucei gambiense DAL972]